APTGGACAAGRGDDVLIGLIGGDDLLGFAGLVERLYLVAQCRRALELLLARRLLHLPRETRGEIVVLALEELLHITYRPRVPLAGLPPRAGRVAPEDEVLDARTLEPPVDLDRARP